MTARDSLFRSEIKFLTQIMRQICAAALQLSIALKEENHRII